jgi:hypothetical protein
VPLGCETGCAAEPRGDVARSQVPLKSGPLAVSLDRLLSDCGCACPSEIAEINAAAAHA